MKRLFIFLTHFSYWLIYVLITGGFVGVISASVNKLNEYQGSSDDPISWGSIYLFIGLLPAPFGFYIFYFYIFKIIKERQSFFKISIKTLINILLVATFSMSLFCFQFYKEKGVNFFDTDSITINFFTILSILSILTHGLLGLFMRAFFNWFQLRKEKEQLTEQNHQIEIELVKAQLNPHFLFNSLNNIDVLIHKDQEKASDFLNRLSDIMRYMLFESKSEKVRFVTELHFIEKYVSLHQLRASNSDYVTIQNKVANTDGFIASLVFIPFIENAFKYASSFKTGNAIQIEFIEEQHTLRFICKNRIATESGDLISSNGLGNQLLKKRLDLIYKETYTLNIQEENEYFCVDLTIPYEAN
jgi:hypothetical protein